MPPNHSTFENCHEQNQPPPEQQRRYDDVDVTEIDSTPITDGTISSTSAVLRCAILGCGMMGQEHCSYIMGYAPHTMQLKYICDPHIPSVQQCLHVIQEFSTTTSTSSKKDIVLPQLVYSERELFEQHLYDIDVLVIATFTYCIYIAMGTISTFNDIGRETRRSVQGSDSIIATGASQSFNQGQHLGSDGVSIYSGHCKIDFFATYDWDDQNDYNTRKSFPIFTQG
jgi:hypothetical protein